MDSTVPVSDKSGRHILQDFLRKVLRLAANRLHDLCGRLDLQDASREEIETQVCTPVFDRPGHMCMLVVELSFDHILLTRSIP